MQFKEAPGILVLAAVCLFSSLAHAEDPWLTLPDGNGPGRGKHIVLIAGDEEYRSEEAMPMLAKILSVHHGFRCTVLFPIDPQQGTIDPINQTNIPGLEELGTADMMVIATRFRELPDEQMKHVDEFVRSGKPILGLRTATHAFSYSRNQQSPYAKYSFNFRGQPWEGGFGRQVLGETWVNHHGAHGKESTRGAVNPQMKDHPILNGVEDIWGPTDVYTVRDLPEGAQVLVYGQVLQGMDPADPPVRGEKNDPMMPLVWVRHYTGESGKTSRVICTTMGASVDLSSEGLRRLLVNACYWGLGMEGQIPTAAKVDYVGQYAPTYFGFGKHKPDMKPSDYGIQ